MGMKIVQVASSDGSLGRNVGCEKAPKEICKYLNGFCIDYVNVVKGNLDETGKNIERAEGDIFIGGDHSLTYFSFKGFAKRKKDPGLLILDAHLDCDYYTKSVTYEDFVRKLIDEKILKKENVIWVGVRRIFKVEKEFSKGLNIFKINSIKRNLRSVCRKVINLCRGFSDVYLSIDIDVVDPVFAPGTGHRERNGMTEKEILFFLKKLKCLHNIEKIDLVEINPVDGSTNLRRSNLLPLKSFIPQTKSTGLKCVASCTMRF